VSEQNGELTLEELVRRLEALERKNAELRGSGPSSCPYSL
jgi:hypothetical protein